MRTRTARLIGGGLIGFLVIMLGVIGATAVTATGTGNCDPTDLTCLRNAKLYASNVCAPTNTTCIQAYQAAGLAICAPSDAQCAATYQSIINAPLSVPAPVTNILPTATAVATVATPVPGANILSNTSPNISPPPITPAPSTDQYGINICGANDLSCLQTNQAKGIPVCPPDDTGCLATYRTIVAPIPTFAPATNTPDMSSGTGSGLKVYGPSVPGYNNNPTGVGTIHTNPPAP